MPAGIVKTMDIIRYWDTEVNDYYARTVRAMGTAKIAYNVWDNLKISSVFTVDYSLTKDFSFSLLKDVMELLIRDGDVCR